MADEHAPFMRRALELAARGLWTTEPNPRVGCVLVRDGNIVGEGWHVRPGEAHAEVNAISDAGSAARGATAYVTLEPCCHQGKTGPCTTALIEAGVAEVHAAMVDPNPLVAGKGFTVLEAAGVRTFSGLMGNEASALNPGFISRMSRGRPFVRLKLAMSLDGRTAMASGESQWITGSEARRDVQRLRARSGAIMTGIGTLLADNPSLTVRAEQLGTDPAQPLHQPMRVVLDSHARTPTDSKMLALPGITLIATGRAQPDRTRALRECGAEVIELELEGQRVDPRAMLTYLGDREVNEVLLECGQTLAGSMLEAGLVDEIYIYCSPMLLGNDARGLCVMPGVQTLGEAIRLEIIDIRPVGADWRVIAHPVQS